MLVAGLSNAAVARKRKMLTARPSSLKPSRHLVITGMRFIVKKLDLS
jgi:hypothetical protein